MKKHSILDGMLLLYIQVQFQIDKENNYEQDY